MAALTQLIEVASIPFLRFWPFASSIGKFTDNRFDRLDSLATVAAYFDAFARVAAVAGHPCPKVCAAATRAG